MKNNPDFVPQGKETKAEFLLLVNRSTYRARFVTSSAIHVAEAGEWDIAVSGETILVTFPRGRILDPQNRGWVTEMLRVIPAQILIPYGHSVHLSSLGAHPRYYVSFPGACSLTLESAVIIDCGRSQKP